MRVVKIVTSHHTKRAGANYQLSLVGWSKFKRFQHNLGHIAPLKKLSVKSMQTQRFSINSP